MRKWYLSRTTAPYRSCQKGLSAGMDAVSSDWKALVAQEL